MKFAIDKSEFSSKLKKAISDESINAFISPLVNYNLDDDEIRNENNSENYFTIKALYRLGFKWSLTDMNYIEMSIGMLEMLGFFDIE